jgi:hypothetical protein
MHFARKLRQLNELAKYAANCTKIARRFLHVNFLRLPGSCAIRRVSFSALTLKEDKNSNED